MGIFFFLFLCLTLAGALEMKSLQINDTKSLFAVLDSLPKECEKNGKKYKEGEKFELGRLRYQCQKYGVYSIEGCRTEKNESLNIGESMVKDNVLHQCLKSGYSVYYKETVCGTMGQPDCDKIPKPSGWEKAEKSKPEVPKGKKVEINGLPQGWQIFEEGAKKIPGTNATLISRTLIFNPLSLHNRVRRQHGHGIGSVVGIEDPGTEKPPMPMEMLMGGKKVVSASKGEKKKISNQSSSSQKKPKIISTQEMRTALRIKNPETSSFTAGSVAGSRSDVVWKGKTTNFNGKQMAVGPGTFTFGNHPTGAFTKKP